MAFTTDDFDNIWASTSPLTPYEFSEANYKEGWNFIGSTPPARQMWDGIQKLNDEKTKYLFDSLSAGNPVTLTADDGNGNSASLVLNPSGSATWNGKEIERVNASGTDYIRYESGLQICWGGVAGSGDSSGTTVTFPVAFNSNPIVTATANSITATTNHVSVQVGVSNGTSCNIMVSVNTVWSSASFAARYIAIGYWK